MRSFICALFMFWVTQLSASNYPPVIYLHEPEAISLQAGITPTADFWRLLGHYETQKTLTYCGIASAVTVLNTLKTSNASDPIYYPYHYLTQERYFTPEVVVGLPPKTVMSHGMNLRQMENSLIHHGVEPLAISGDQLGIDDFRQLLLDTTNREDILLMTLFSRATLKQRGTGHWSVIAAYDAHSDRVLVLDVATFHNLPFWVDATQLRDAMDTQDAAGATRGLMIVGRAANRISQ